MIKITEVIENYYELKERTKRKIQSDIFSLIDEYFWIMDQEKDDKLLRLVIPSYSSNEVKEAIDSLLSTYVTMGKKCLQFEKNFAEYIGTKHAILVNSGSSANLIALKTLSSKTMKNRIKAGEEIITPAVTWSTTVFPIYDVLAIPVFVDVELESLTLNIEEIKEAITKKTKAIMPVHLLGNACNMKAIKEIAEDYNLFVIEDCCEAHGSEFNNQKVGSFGDISTFSFFFSHHITTIEGGMLLTNNQKYQDIAKSIRAHGWIRERSDRDKISEKYPAIDKRFMFIHTGYNLRPTELTGAFGIHQLSKLDEFIENRIKAAKFLIDKLSVLEEHLILPKFQKNIKQAWFGFPILLKNTSLKNDFLNYLEINGIETRSIMSGNFVNQPVLKSLKHRTINDLPNSQFIHENGFFIGLHNAFDEKRLEKAVAIFLAYFEKKRS